MLVLSRMVNEVIVIGDGIRVTVVDIRGDKVRLGIEAPREVTVHREEVYNAIHAERLPAEAACEFDDGGPTREDLGID
jgi:carbon storage regulator